MNFYRLVVPVLIGLLMIGCGGSSSKRLARGSYDSAITKAVKNLQKDPSDHDERNILKKAYEQSVTESMAVIDRLVEQNNGESLLQVVREYQSLERVTNQISSLPHEVNRHFHLKNYAEDIQHYTRLASDVLFGEGEALMQSPIQADHRTAYDKFMAIRSINPQFPSINRWIGEAENLATSKILISVQDKSRYRFRDTLISFLREDKLDDLNQEKWLRYYLSDNQQFFGEVKIMIAKIGIEQSPKQTETHNYSKQLSPQQEAERTTSQQTEKPEEVEDKVQTITAKVVEEKIDYEIILRGTITYVNHYTGQAIRTEELLSKDTFTRTLYQVSGNESAIDVEMKQKIEANEGKVVPDEKDWVQQQIPGWNLYVYGKIRESRSMF